MAKTTFIQLVDKHWDPLRCLYSSDPAAYAKKAIKGLRESAKQNPEFSDRLNAKADQLAALDAVGLSKVQ